MWLLMIGKVFVIFPSYQNSSFSNNKESRKGKKNIFKMLQLRLSECDARGSLINPGERYEREYDMDINGISGYHHLKTHYS